MLIKIKNMRLTTKMGVYDWEKDFARELIINAVLEINGSAPAKTDKIADTVDYDFVINLIKDHIANNYHQLLEKMVGDILDKIMINPLIKSASLEIDKVGVYDFVESFSVSDIRKNNHDSINR